MYAEKNVTALKAIAKERGLKGYSKFRKAELIEALETRDRTEALKLTPAEVEEVVDFCEPKAAPIVVKGRSVGATTVAAEAAKTVRVRLYPNTTARNTAKRKRRAIRASGGVAGW